MKYMGSKARISKEILPIILKDIEQYNFYVEPFVGGCNLIDKVTFSNKIANDIHYELIEMWKAIQQGWIPPENISEEEYHNIQHNRKDFEPALVGFVGFACSFGAKYFGGYARGKNSNGTFRNYAKESKIHILKQAPKLEGIVFNNLPYNELFIPERSIIYCDPPYANSTKYKTNAFDYDMFWNWCRTMVMDNDSQVFVSEYCAPDDFECVYSTNILTTISKNNYRTGVEKLFTYKMQTKG